jgi:uncharacterized protein YndB with AHSA1/START domain
MSMSDEPRSRSIVLEVEVVGAVEEVWRAIATGPGISSWYVPHTVEEREGGAATARFGEGPEMLIPGRVAAWEPPRRVVFDGGEGVDGLVFEWLVEAHSAGTCIVRLVNSGFVAGAPWDDQYDDMTKGWQLFLLNLQLHLEHFRGREATAILPMAMWNGRQAAVWERLTGLLGLDATLAIGQRVSIAADGAPSLSGTVVSAAAWRLALLLDDPCPGTAFIAVEGGGDTVAVSIWSYLYGPDRESIAARDEPQWHRWLADRSNL